MMSKLFGKMMEDTSFAGPQKRNNEPSSDLESKQSCNNCGAVASDGGNVYPKIGSIVRAGLFNACPLHGRRTSLENNGDDLSASTAVDGLGTKILSTLKQTFGKRKPREEPVQHLQEILGHLKFLNGWLEGRVNSNETRYSYWKTKLENEERHLEENYSTLKGSDHSLNLLRCGIGSVNEGIVNMMESERRRQHELENLEAEVRRHEPALFRKYQTLQRKPGNNDVIFNAILTSVADKRKALDKMEKLLNMWQENNATINEPQNENPLMMILPTKMPVLARPPASSDRRFRFIFPIGATAKLEDPNDSA